MQCPNCGEILQKVKSGFNERAILRASTLAAAPRFVFGSKLPRVLKPALLFAGARWTAVSAMALGVVALALGGSAFFVSDNHGYTFMEAALVLGTVAVMLFGQALLFAGFAFVLSRLETRAAASQLARFEGIATEEPGWIARRRMQSQSEPDRKPGRSWIPRFRVPVSPHLVPRILALLAGLGFLLLPQYEILEMRRSGVAAVREVANGLLKLDPAYANGESVVMLTIPLAFATLILLAADARWIGSFFAGMGTLGLMATLYVVNFAKYSSGYFPPDERRLAGFCYGLPVVAAILIAAMVASLMAATRPRRET